ncbi:hypothetical protein AB2M62_13940 [Sphingomonas sp. MMS12-HWE2-04]|uniref:hypothetical protein n=1 Tax=Sphingomonas sp. MMS12-HWE2-04 TaxID=3234199 RepID=UPI003851418D
MSLQNIHLRKILKIMYLEGGARIAALRADIREEIAREEGRAGEGGGDFYGPFWRDAKDHVFGATDLHEQTRIRIQGNPGRANLYGQLRDGFLLWWDERRRWTNEPFRPADAMKTVCRVAGVDADIKVANILSVRDGRDEDHFVYPYWFPDPQLSEEAARLGLWLLCEAFRTVDRAELRLLDVIRGRTFSLDRNSLQGDEPTIFHRRHAAALAQWNELRREY